MPQPTALQLTIFRFEEQSQAKPARRKMPAKLRTLRTLIGAILEHSREKWKREAGSETIRRRGASSGVSTPRACHIGPGYDKMGAETKEGP